GRNSQAWHPSSDPHGVTRCKFKQLDITLRLHRRRSSMRGKSFAANNSRARYGVVVPLKTFRETWFRILHCYAHTEADRYSGVVRRSENRYYVLKFAPHRRIPVEGRLVTTRELIGEDFDADRLHAGHRGHHHIWRNRMERDRRAAERTRANR